MIHCCDLERGEKKATVKESNSLARTGGLLNETTGGGSNVGNKVGVLVGDSDGVLVLGVTYGQVLP